MKIKKQTYPPVNMGISLMLVTFLVLCMMIFAVLSVSSALKDYQYSQKNAQRTSAYYDANNTAEEILAALYEKVPAKASDGLSIQGIPISVTESILEYTVPISDAESLYVVLEKPSFGKPEYTILTWKQIPTQGWTGSQTLPVLGSD